MSLKVFHVVFITLSTLLCVGIVVQEVWSFRAGGGSEHVVGATVAAMVGVALVIYGVWFLKKARRLIL